MLSIRLICVLTMAATLAVALSGCGGEGGVVITRAGIYVGEMDGDGTGPLRFYIDPDGSVTGNFRVPPICNGPVSFTGTVDDDGNITFQGTACGIAFQGTGTVEPQAPGSNVFVGSGTWTGDDGSIGTWGATWTARTGSISV